MIGRTNAVAGKSVVKKVTIRNECVNGDLRSRFPYNIWGDYVTINSIGYTGGGALSEYSLDEAIELSAFLSELKVSCDASTPNSVKFTLEDEVLKITASYEGI